MVFVLFCLLALVPSAGALAQGNPRLRIATTGDPQNYFTTEDQGNDPNVFKMLVDMQIADIVAYHPDLVIIAGDLTDSTGGLDAGCPASIWRIGDDPNSQGAVNSLGLFPDDEWSNFRQYEYDVLRRAGIPVFLVVGNHDSAVDFERHFPASEWLTYSSISPEVDVRLERAGGQTFSSGPQCTAPLSWTGATTSTDSSIRKALISTSIGTICVLGMPSSSVDIDVPWVQARIGCGADRPTIIVDHAGIAVRTVAFGLTAQKKSDIIANVYGHLTGCTYCMLQNSVVNSGLSYLTVFDNTQEELSGAPGTGVCSADKFRFCSTSTDCSDLTPNTCLGTAH